MKTLKQIADKMEYPGRFLILDQNQENIIAVYGVTARSAASCAKQYVYNDNKNKIIVKPTDIKIMSQGDLDLLSYNAVNFFKNGFIIGNGKQTDCIKLLEANNATNKLDQDLLNQTFEPDKYHTPRITGCVMQIKNKWTLALNIIRDLHSDNVSVQNTFDLTNNLDSSHFISTYSGENIRPTPSFIGEPIKTEKLTGNVKQVCTNVFSAYRPKENNKDLRVSVIAISIKKSSGEISSYIINKY